MDSDMTNGKEANKTIKDNDPNKGMKGILLLSGGIDSPVAGKMMLDRGLDLIMLHMDNRPFTDDREFGKVKRLASRLSELAGRPLPFYVAKHGLLAQAPTAKNIDRHFHCILCRRTMLRTAERLAKQEGADFIVTGESMGQVASQTLRNLGVEEDVTSMPILRPLVGLDKTEIIDIGREFDTFDISISPGLCCTIVPEKPSTKAKLSKIKEEEAKIDVPGMMDSLMASLELVSLE